MAQLIKYIFILFICLTFQRVDAQIFVSPHGNDNNPGTKEQALATLSGAKKAARKFKQNANVTVPVTITVGDGFYQMTEPLLFSPEDGGTTDNPIIYKAANGAKPIFSGGQKITGFKVNNDGIWEAKISGAANSKQRFDQLYVNGKRATLARTPNKGFLKIGEIKQNIWDKGTGRVADKAQQIISFDKENFQSLDKINDDELELVRFKAYHKWDFTLRFIDKIEKDSKTVYTSGKGMKPWNPIVKGGRIVFENFKAALDSPGEWFLNKKGTLFYFPLPGETPQNTTVIAPQLENLITISGDATNNKYVENIRFEGLSFTHCHYRMPKTGSEPNQAAALINAAIMLEGAKNIQFTNCEISQTGQHALWFRKGCSDSKVEHCFLNDLGGGGIYLGGFSNSEEHTHHIVIHNNIIQSGGKEFPSAVGIWVGHSSDNTVSHNDISNLYYTGISLGWTWGYANSFAKNNKVIYNHIHHIGWDLLSDMAAVYTLGKSEGTEINNNTIHNIHAYWYGGWGLYTDEGSSGIIMKDNLVYNTKTGGFHQHYGKDNFIQNNIFAFAKLYQAQCSRVEKHRSFNFENNILLFNEGVVLQGVWENINIQMDKNLYWNTKGGKYSFNRKSFKKWQKTGHDSNSVIANPHFIDASAFNFEFKNKSNISKIDFKVFDYSKAGVYGGKKWIEKAKLPTEILIAFDKAVDNNMKQEAKRH